MNQGSLLHAYVLVSNACLGHGSKTHVSERISTAVARFIFCIRFDFVEMLKADQSTELDLVFLFYAVPLFTK